MRGYGALRSPRRRRLDNVTERAIFGQASKATGTPFPKIVLNASFQRFTENEPRFPHGTRHDADFGKLHVRVLGAIATAHGHDQSNNFTAALESGSSQCTRNDVRQ